MLNGSAFGRSTTIRRKLSRATLPKSLDLELITAAFSERTARACQSPSSEVDARCLRMVLPPPNVTGRLHLGHALTVAIEDSIARHHRMHTGEAEWLPGFDHAGIATQSVVERELWKREGRTRHDFTREQFILRCSQWAKQNAVVIREQLTRMGATLAWDRQYYTLDKNFSSAVSRAFVILHGEGLVSRSRRFVHWCPSLRSSISDQEVDVVECSPGGSLSLPSPGGKGRRLVPFGIMHIIRYELVGGGCSGLPRWLEVATTRPETIPADVALAVHPSHSLANLLVGKRVRNPLSGEELPVVADERVLVDKGTGVLKITPAHDRLDADIASRHWEEIEAVVPDARERGCIDASGRVYGSSIFAGTDRYDAREQVLSFLRESGAVVRSVEGQTSSLPVCSRTGDVIEPRQEWQWFLDCSQLHAEAENALTQGRIAVVPVAQQQRLLDWFRNGDPWCLSRQLAWGHRIPAWRRDGEGESSWAVAETEDKARELLSTGQITQDQDVLDTWFSSSLVPVVVGGWMEGRREWPSPPLDLLETGHDILGFWVARMIALTLKLSGGQVPFSRVILHGLVRDPEGRKMSKSLGNVVDPFDVLDGISLEEMEKRLGESGLADSEKATALASLRGRFPSGIPRCGPDALRFALLRHDILASDVPIDIGLLATEGLRFCNKLWHLVAYAEQVREKVGGGKEEGRSEDPMDRYLLSRLSSTLLSVCRHMDNDSPHLAFSSLHQFILSNLADVYIESTKRALWDEDLERLRQVDSTLTLVLSLTLRQLSAFMPFVSEFLYERISSDGIYEGMMEFSPSWVDSSLDASVSQMLAVVSAARSLKQTLGVPMKTPFTGILHSVHPPSSLLPLSSLLFSLSSISLQGIIPLEEPSPHGFEATPVPGHEARLALKVEEHHRTEMQKSLEEKLRKAIEKKEQYIQKAEHYDNIAKSESNRGARRDRAAAKNEKKAEHARGVATSAAEEEKRIRRMMTSTCTSRNSVVK